MKVLIAEDDSVNRLLLQRFFEKWGYEVMVATDGSEAWKIIQEEEGPRLVILDWMMPGMDGVEICRRVRASSKQSYVYVILLTARFQKQDIITGLEAGADDYITKPFDSNELQARLRAGTRILQLEEDLRAAHDGLRFQATHDSMTGLWTHAAIRDMLRAEMARAQRESKPVSVVLADLDHFKQINDTYGHLAGDFVLEETARRFLAAVRPYDFVGRYGGEEFLIVLSGCDFPQALALTERLRLRIGQTPFATPEGSLQLTISAGVTCAANITVAEVDSIIRACDAALYEAKRRGRNRVESRMPNVVHWESGLPSEALASSEGRGRPIEGAPTAAEAT